MAEEGLVASVFFTVAGLETDCLLSVIDCPDGFDCLAGAACLTDVLFFSGVDFLTFELLPDDWRVVLVAVRDSVFRA